MPEFVNKMLNGHTQIIVIILSIIGLAGGLVGVYSNIKSDIVENRRATNDVNEKLNEFMKSQKEYNQEMRTFVFTADDKIREGMRTIVEKLLDAKR